MIRCAHLFPILHRRLRELLRSLDERECCAANRSRRLRRAAETVPQDIAWLMFTKGLRREFADARLRVTGDADLGRHVLGTIAIVG